MKSGYKHLQGMRRGQRGSEVHSWSVIWKLSKPTKVKNFVWRAGTELLPMMLAL